MKPGPVISIVVRKGNDTKPAEIELWKLPGGKLSVRLLGVTVGFVDDEFEALKLPRIREYLAQYNPTLLAIE